MKRNPVFDLMKFVAIVMVVLQHFIRRYGLGMEMMNVWPGKIIIMVDMPLFIFMSGWFAGSLHNKTFGQFVVTRYKSLVRPTIVYSVLSAIICGLLMNTLPTTMGGAGKFLFHSLVSSYWFVWVIIYCSFVAWTLFVFCGFVGKGKPMILMELMLMAIVLGASLFIPDGFIPQIQYFKAMFPFFIMGYGFRCIDFFESLRPFKYYAIVICGLLYFGTSFVFQGRWSFYYFGLTSLPNLIYYYLLMIVVGFCGIVAIYYFLEFCVMFFDKRTGFGNKILNVSIEIGSYTLAIYLIQGVLMSVLGCYKEQLCLSSNWANYGLSLVSTLVFMVIVYYMIHLFLKNKWTSRYLLGKEPLSKNIH